MTQKHLLTPPAGEVIQPLPGVLLFRLPCPEHLIVVELCQLPSAKQFPAAIRTFIWKPTDPERVYSDHAHREQELFVCLEGPVDWTLWNGQQTAAVRMQKGDALFLPRWIWHETRIQAPGPSLLVHCETSYDRRGSYIEHRADYEFFMWLPSRLRRLVDANWRIISTLKRLRARFSR